MHDGLIALGCFGLTALGMVLFAVLTTTGSPVHEWIMRTAKNVRGMKGTSELIR